MSAATAPRKPKDGLCIHAGCRCEVESGQNYCGDYCSQEPQTGMEAQAISCRCGHDECGGRADPAFHT